MAYLATQRNASVIALVLAAGVARCEDLFSLLEPEAFATSQSEAPAIDASSAPVAGSRKVEPARLAAQPIPTVPPVADGVTVTDAIESIPAPLLPIGPEAQLMGPAVALSEPLPANTLSRSIFGLTVDAAADPELVGQMANIPDNLAIHDAAIDRFGAWDAPAREATQTPPRFAGGIVTFAAPAAYSRPLYFEQPNLERYGHHVAFCEHDHLTQSALSAAHFFATVPILPYKMGANPPDECNYVLGSYRPGSCNPHELLKPQLSVGGSVLEGVAVTGLIFLIP